MLQETPSRDDITGIEEPQPEDIKTIVQVIKQGEALANLQQSEGWHLILDFIEMNCKGLLDKLKVEQSMEVIRKIQCQLYSFESLPMMLEKALIDAEQAKREVDAFLTEQN